MPCHARTVAASTAAASPLFILPSVWALQALVGGFYEWRHATGSPWLLLVPQIHPCSPCIPSLVLLQAMVGGFKDTPIDDLVVAVLKETLKRTGVKPEVGGVHCSSKGGQIWSARAAVVGRGRHQIGSMHATQEAGAIDGNKKSTEDSLWWEIVCSI